MIWGLLGVSSLISYVYYYCVCNVKEWFIGGDHRLVRHCADGPTPGYISSQNKSR